jgi:hypothetical protein
MPVLAIKTGTTEISGSVVKGSFSYFSGSTKDLGPTNITGFYSGIDAPVGGYTVYQIGGSGGWTARVATSSSQLNSILISAGGTGSTVNDNITWATNTNSVLINSGDTAPTYTIGQSALGGKIAYILQPGDPGYDADVQHGLVAATSDQSTSIYWYNGSYVTTGAIATALGTGLANTNTIIAVQGAVSTNYAAGLARAHNGGGYTDWYLPSKDELTKVFLNKVAIGGFAQFGSYWSSSEVDVNYCWIYYNYFSQPFSVLKGGNLLWVRAIRSF